MFPLGEVVVVYLFSLVASSIIYVVFTPEFLVSYAFIFGSLLEFFSVGFLCIVFAILDGDDGELFGLTSRGLVRSLLIGFGLMAIHIAFRCFL